MPSKISWTDETWNPVVGCTKVSPGCAHCYAERMYGRFNPGGNFNKVTLHPERLDQPLHWRKPRRVFVCSMGDLFHEDVPDIYIARVFARMEAASQHTFQMLTKRPERMLAWFQTAVGSTFDSVDGGAGDPWPLSNVWLGVSAENQEWAGRRIPTLLQIPAAKHFVSLEPMLGPIDMGPWFPVGDEEECPRCTASGMEDPWMGDGVFRDGQKPCGRCMGSGRVAGKAALDWVVLGAESGPGFRPFDIQWARDVRDQCVAAGIPFHLKQLGGLRPGGPALLDGREWREFPA